MKDSHQVSAMHNIYLMFAERAYHLQSTAKIRQRVTIAILACLVANNFDCGFFEDLRHRRLIAAVTEGQALQVAFLLQLTRHAALSYGDAAESGPGHDVRDAKRLVLQPTCVFIACRS
jgi:hypothetical protein